MDSLTADIWILPEHWGAMEQDVMERADQEACGVVAGKDRQTIQVFPIENVLQSRVRYQCKPQDQLRVFHLLEENHWDLLAIYHSHPDGPPIPSPTDLEEAAYPEAIHLIWSPIEGSWQCRGFLIQEGTFQEVSIIRCADKHST